MDWTTDIENLLEQIRQNSVNLSTNHKKNYFFYKSLHKYFRIPTIILASIASVSSVGLQPYIAQQHVSVLTCLIGIIVSIINSIELYLKLQETLESELNMSKEFYNLSIDIHKCLVLDRGNRLISGQAFLNEKYSSYVKLSENSDLMTFYFYDRLAQIPKMKNKHIKNNSSPIPTEVGSHNSDSSESDDHIRKNIIRDLNHQSP